MASSIPLVSPKDLPLEVQMEWYKIRDMFCGRNYVKQNIPLAIELASKCHHPDAEWLAKVCLRKSVKTKDDAIRAFLALGPKDARAICFVWLFAINKSYNVSMLEQSAVRGFAFARVLFALTENNFKNAEVAALQGERDGYYNLGIHFQYGQGCTANWEKAKNYLLIASKLGHVSAMINYGMLFVDNDPRKWKWWGRAARNGAYGPFLDYFSRRVKSFLNGKDNAPVVFVIGKALHGHVDGCACTIFHSVCRVERCVLNAARFAITFYQTQLEASRRAVDEWTKIALRFRVCKDIRKLIGQMIWSARKEALY